MIRKTALVLCLSLLSAPLAQAGDDPSIKGQLRTDVQAAMEAFIAHQTIEGTYRHYDPVDGRLLHLEKPNLHAGIVKKGDYYISCADFTDQDGRSIDVDFLVLDAGGEIRAVQGLVHKIDGKKRPYHLEND